ncbi:MAG TPA: flavin reductase [Lacibacter sp.]|nr:flavin reductase [Lacibacter sp.]HMO90335.1 flavin reductase [Lacibacter sp.]HMP86553.1 flavin reductase [Lacibacter sp.]
MLHINAATIQSWERFYRANFINSLTGAKPVSLIGTVNRKGQPNLGVFSNIIHVGADPALVGYINRPREAAPHTLSNIESIGIYTINHIHAGMLAQAHQCSAKYPEGVSEFAETGLTPLFVEGCAAPFVQESRIRYALSLQDVVPIHLNNTFLVIGKIEQVMLEEDVLEPDGFLRTDRAGSLCSGGLDGYYSNSFITRYRYAKPGIPLQELAGEAGDAG